MARHELVVVGASAGGVEALRTMIDGLDPELAAAVCVVQHVPAQASSLLPILLQRHPQLPASHAVDGEPIQPRHIYVAPPDHHLLVQGTVLRLGHGPRENNSRPAIDPLFRSAARWYGERCIGVVLSGMLDDGTAGLVSIKQAGGVTIAQDPADAQYPSMPRSAIEEAQVDHVASAHGIGRLVSKLVRERGSAKPEAQGDDARSEAEADVALAGSEDATPAEIAKGVPASFGCPECGGALWRLEDGRVERYRCRVGHAYSGRILSFAQHERFEEAIWTALRALREHVDLLLRLGTRSRGMGMNEIALRYDARAGDAQRRVETLQDMLATGVLHDSEDARLPARDRGQGG